MFTHRLGSQYGPYNLYSSIVNIARMGNIAAMAEIIYPIKKLAYLTEEQARAISDFRFAYRLQSENEAIRRLVDLGLEAVKRGQKEKA